MVVVADIGVIDGTDPGGRCEIVGTGPVPASILAELSPDTRLTGMIFAGRGRPLWMGRSLRLANIHQHLAVVVRDRGCVTCGAPMQRCEIHHVREWQNGGVTDIDNLMALCGPITERTIARTVGQPSALQAGAANRQPTLGAGTADRWVDGDRTGPETGPGRRSGVGQAADLDPVNRLG